MLKIGVVIADLDEYKPIYTYAQKYNAEDIFIANRQGHLFNIEIEGKQIQIKTILCGIGKVNAAAAATALCEQGCIVILNYGLSGGISGVARNDISVPTSFLEHDFDLTGIGYKPCEKPGQDYIYRSDNFVNDIILSVFKDAKTGVAVTGDRFIQNDTERNYLSKQFGATSCDMETAAIAYVTTAYNVKFGCFRKISDDAGNDAGVHYRKINSASQTTLIDGLFEIIGLLSAKMG